MARNSGNYKYGRNSDNYLYVNEHIGSFQSGGKNIEVNIAGHNGTNLKFDIRYWSGDEPKTGAGSIGIDLEGITHLYKLLQILLVEEVVPKKQSNKSSGVYAEGFEDGENALVEGMPGGFPTWLREDEEFFTPEDTNGIIELYEEYIDGFCDGYSYAENNELEDASFEIESASEVPPVSPKAPPKDKNVQTVVGKTPYVNNSRSTTSRDAALKFKNVSNDEEVIKNNINSLDEEEIFKSENVSLEYAIDKTNAKIAELKEESEKPEFNAFKIETDIEKLGEAVKNKEKAVGIKKYLDGLSEFIIDPYYMKFQYEGTSFYVGEKTSGVTYEINRDGLLKDAELLDWRAEVPMILRAKKTHEGVTNLLGVILDNQKLTQVEVIRTSEEFERYQRALIFAERSAGESELGVWMLDEI
ncbi:MAG: hypothetical protein LBN08_01835 [Lactobacillales bacterium]|jgi:hypothetical protein|nr:hypothetical protein [Lactobacillales bacterium]